ncbi:hypothetical protein [Streptomyces sp. Act143]|uniref:hypothetical protein n=1 Tax=Streptomyces sp. Act143 TaxID=2200760 RepID=UPI0015E7EC7A|nr:hypothetical protein [Streptomyces sp. Act143]
MDMSTGVPAVDGVLVWGGAISLLLGVGTAVWRVGRAALQLFQRTTQFLDDWYGEGPRPGVPARPGVLERMAGMEERLARVYHEVYPNGGDSLRDAVNQANDRLAILCPDPCTQEPPSEPPILAAQPDPPDESSGR